MPVWIFNFVPHTVYTRSIRVCCACILFTKKKNKNNMTMYILLIIATHTNRYVSHTRRVRRCCTIKVVKRFTVKTFTTPRTRRYLWKKCPLPNTYTWTAYSVIVKGLHCEPVKYSYILMTHSTNPSGHHSRG